MSAGHVGGLIIPDRPSPNGPSGVPNLEASGGRGREVVIGKGFSNGFLDPLLLGDSGGVLES
jgi:hypothetical protein